MDTLFYWLLFVMQLLSCGSQTNNKGSDTLKRFDYDLSVPDKVYSLPLSLHEISGITEVDGSTIACVQDEHGIVYLYNINNNQIIRQIIFGGEGDYEAIARVDKTLYVLRSDEVLIEITDFNSAKFNRHAYFPGIPGRDCEGLCYDRNNNRLLIVPKENTEDNPENKGKRLIYGFDLASKKLIKGPVINLDIPSIKKFAVENNIRVPMKGKKGEKEEPDIELRISEISIHPMMNRLFVISAVERILFVFNMDGHIEYLMRLDKDLFKQPEGITFLKNGDMLISNEGGSGLPTMLRFNYRQIAVTP